MSVHRLNRSIPRYDAIYPPNSYGMYTQNVCTEPFFLILP